MPTFSQKSRDKLLTCDQRLIEIMEAAILEMDFTVLCGHRGEIEQNEAFISGHSRAKWPKSAHNKIPSLGVDVAPYPIIWNDLKRFEDLAKIVKRIASAKGIEITWGGDFQTLRDCPHFEVKA